MKYIFLWLALVCRHEILSTFEIMFLCREPLNMPDSFPVRSQKEGKKEQHSCYWQEELRLHSRKCQGCQESNALLCVWKKTLAWKNVLYCEHLILKNLLLPHVNELWITVRMQHLLYLFIVSDNSRISFFFFFVCIIYLFCQRDLWKKAIFFKLPTVIMVINETCFTLYCTKRQDRI